MKTTILVVLIVFTLKTAAQKTTVAFRDTLLEITNPENDSIVNVYVRLTIKPSANFQLTINDTRVNDSLKNDYSILLQNKIIYIETARFTHPDTLISFPLLIKNDTNNIDHRIIVFSINSSDTSKANTSTGNFLLFIRHRNLKGKSADLDQPDFSLDIGGNFDFDQHVSVSNLAAEINLFLPDIFTLCKFDSIKSGRFGLDLGLYENKTVSVDSASTKLYTFRSLVPNDTNYYTISNQFAKKKSSTEIQNFGVYGSLIYRMNDEDNKHFRVYAELNYELINRSFKTTNTYVPDTTQTFLSLDTGAAHNIEPDVKPEVETLNFTEEYLSIGIQNVYTNGKFEYSGQLLIGKFNSPLSAFKNKYYEHFFTSRRNWFYNFTFSLSYLHKITLAGEIRRNDFTKNNNPYFIVEVSTRFDMDKLYDFIVKN